MRKLGSISSKWQFYAFLILMQFLMIPYTAKNFSFDNIGGIIITTLSNSYHLKLGNYNIFFQLLSLVMLGSLFIFRNRMRLIFNIYVTLSYIFYAFIQNIANTEHYGLSIVTVNVMMFLLVAYVWFKEIFRHKNDYSFPEFKWEYSWMIPLSAFAYYCPVNSSGDFDFNPVLFFTKNSSTAFCLMTPLFLTIMTFNIPRINIITYRITAIIGIIIVIYNMGAFFNPNTVNMWILHIPLLSISLFCCILSYNTERKYKYARHM